MTSEENHTTDKKTLCVFEQTRRVPEVYICKVPTFDFGKALGEKYPLLRLVFNYLPYNDLQNCALVNDTWNDYAIEALKARKVMESGWFAFTKLKQKEYLLDCNTYHDMSCGLVFCNRSFHQHKSICLHKGEDFQKLDALEVVSKKFVGENIPFILCYCISVEKCSNIDPVMMTGILIPKLPNTVVERFSGMEDQIMGTIEEKIFQKNLEIRALLIFGTRNRVRSYCFVDEILKRQKGKAFALCGGIVRHCKSDLTLQEEMPKRKGPNKIEHCLAIAVPPESTNFQAYSTLCTKLHDYVDCFKSMQRRMILKKHSVAVGCVCIALVVDNVNWVDLFHSHFPHTAITCIEVEGEYGWDKVDEDQNVDRTSIHQFTFALMVLTWD